MQETLGGLAAGMQQAFSGLGGSNPFGSAGAPAGFPKMDFAALKQSPQLKFDAAQLQQVQQKYLADATALWNESLHTDGGASPVDKRFSAEAWAHKEAKMKMGKGIQVISPNEPLPPERKNFKTQEEFEEAQSRWRWTVGRNRAFRERALLNSQQKSSLMENK